MLLQAPSPDSPGLPDFAGITDGLPGWARVVVILAICLALVVVTLPKLLGHFGNTKTSEPSAPASAAPPAALTATSAAAAGEVAVVTEAMSKIVASIEARLDRALAEQEKMQDDIDAMRQQLSTEQRANFQLRLHLDEANRQLEAARGQVQRLQWELDVSRRGLT